jgi:hypothetical protein
MAVNVTKFPQSYYDAATDADISFVNPTNAYSDDGQYVTAQTTKRSANDYIEYYNFGMGIPAGATINSVTFEVEWKCSTTASILSMSCQLYKNRAAVGSAITNSAEPTTDTIQSSSNSGTWSVSELNGNTINDLCLRISVSRGATNTNGDILIDYVKVTVNYDAALYTQYTKVSSVWKPGTLSTKVSGQWKPISAGYKKISGVWTRII